MEKFISSENPIFNTNILEEIDIEVRYTSMVASNKSIFIFGGDAKENFTTSAEVRRYDILGRKWHKMSEMPHYVWGATAQIIDDNIFIIGGGRTVTYTSYNSVYNISGDYWEEKKEMPVSRKGLLSGVIAGMIYITGGYQIWKIYSKAYCYVYNPKRDTWRECQPPIRHRTYGMSVVINNFLYVLGGYNYSTYDCNKTMDRYCPETDLWEAMPSMPRSRVDAVAVAIGSKIFVLGGTTISPKYMNRYTNYNTNGYEDRPATYMGIDYYDTRTRKWTMTNIETPELLSHGVAVVDNKIYLTCGVHDRLYIPYPTFGHSDLITEYNKKLYEITYSGTVRW